jgi:hypothetical protein
MRQTTSAVSSQAKRPVALNAETLDDSQGRAAAMRRRYEQRRRLAARQQTLVSAWIHELAGNRRK